MKTLPNNFILEKNKLASPNATVLLLKITPPASTELDPIYLVRNTENITSDGQEYTAFPFELDMVSESSKGDVPSLVLRVGNVTRALEAQYQAYDGLVDYEVTISAVNVAYPNEEFLAITADVISSHADAQWIYLSLGAPSPLRYRFPPERFMAEYCQWIPGGAECAKPAAAGVCKRTRAECAATFNNLRRFGAQFGLANPTVRLV